MSTVTIGTEAPPFRLPSATGQEISLGDLRGKKHAIIWFTKGMACPFCRQKMSQLARVYPELVRRDAEVLEITPTKPERARFFASKFKLPFPYLCDPEHAVRQQWAVNPGRSHSLLWYAKAFVHGTTMPKPPNDFGDVTPSPGEFPKLLADDDMGLFIVDKGGIVRFAYRASEFTEQGPRPLPGNDEILRELDRSVAAA